MRHILHQVEPVVMAMAASGCGGQSEVNPETQPASASSTSAGGNVASSMSSIASGTTRPVLSCDIPSTPCGGDVVGSWNVVDCPLDLTGQVNVTGFGLGCAHGTTRSGSLEVSGTWSADASGNLSDDTTTIGVHEFDLPEACLEVGTVFGCASIERAFTNGLGHETVECLDNPETGGCVCRGTFNQQGGLGAISSDPVTAGRCSVDGTRLTIGEQGNDTAYAYCVMDDALVMTLPEPGLTGLVVGSIVLQKAE